MLLFFSHKPFNTTQKQVNQKIVVLLRKETVNISHKITIDAEDGIIASVSILLKQRKFNVSRSRA